MGARRNSESLPATALNSAKARLSTTPCWPRLASIITTAITSSWEPPAVNTSASASFPSPIQATLISFDRYQREAKHKRRAEKRGSGLSPDRLFTWSRRKFDRINIAVYLRISSSAYHSLSYLGCSFL